MFSPIPSQFGQVTRRVHRLIPIINISIEAKSYYRLRNQLELFLMDSRSCCRPNLTHYKPEGQIRTCPTHHTKTYPSQSQLKPDQASWSHSSLDKLRMLSAGLGVRNNTGPIQRLWGFYKFLKLSPQFQHSTWTSQKQNSNCFAISFLIDYLDVSRK